MPLHSVVSGQTSRPGATRQGGLSPTGRLSHRGWTHSQRIRRNHAAGQARNARMPTSRRRIGEGSGRGPGGGGLWLDGRDGGGGRRRPKQRSDGEGTPGHGGGPRGPAEGAAAGPPREG